MRSSRIWLTISFLALASPAWSVTQGLRLRINGTLLCTVFQGAVTGGLSTFEGEETENCDITWLDQGMNEFLPPNPPRSFDLAVANSAIMGSTLTGPWSFTITGGTAGGTTMTLRLLLNGVPEYTSPPIPLRAVPEAVGLVVLNHGLEIARVFEATVTGQLRVGAGRNTQSYDVVFLDGVGNKFALPTGVGMSLAASVLDETKATVSLDGPAAFHLHGVAAGSTGLELSIFHIDHIDFTAAAIPVEVVVPTDAGNEDEPAAVPRTVLHPASPNPFNPATTLHYDLARDMRVRVDVFDAGGRVVAVLVDGSQPAGSHAVDWRASGLGSGAYFVRLWTPEATSATRVLLVK